MKSSSVIVPRPRRPAERRGGSSRRTGPIDRDEEDCVIHTEVRAATLGAAIAERGGRGEAGSGSHLVTDPQKGDCPSTGAAAVSPEVAPGRSNRSGRAPPTTTAREGRSRS